MACKRDIIFMKQNKTACTYSLKNLAVILHNMGTF